MRENETDISYINNRIHECIREYESINEIKARECKKIEWNAILLYIYNHAIKPIRNKDKACIYRNDDLIEQLADLYINVCYENLKDISLTGFGYLTGISRSTLNAIRNSNTETYIDIDSNNKGIGTRDINNYRKLYPDHQIVTLSKPGCTIAYEKIATASEQALTSLTLDGSVMALAIGKVKHGWEEGKRAQVAAQLLEDARNTSDLLREYKRDVLPGNDNINI